jgi:Zn-finger nucleic acid-binding protein
MTMSDRGTPGKPSSSEAEYFVREDAEKKRRIALKAQKDLAEADKARLRQLHFMHCPKCGLEMHEVKMEGFDVDVCFGCNGIFLDQGDLEHLRSLQRPPHAIVNSILNWFKDETKKPV